MATHNITLITTPEQEAELQAMILELGATVEQLVQANAVAQLDAAYSNRPSTWFNGLSATEKRALFDVAHP